tara:strand:- start:12 stop:557 length:546 start_codon:yes stop_codon:yes gene_type:complete
MIDALKNYYGVISFVDLIYLIVTILSVAKCYRKGFVLSILSSSRWVLAYIITLFLFSKIKPNFNNIIDNEFVLDISLGIIIFVVVFFIILLINKGISTAVNFVGFGSFDSIFGIFFGFVKSYVVCVCLFSAINIVYNYDKWPINSNKSYIFPYLKKGSNYLLKVFPNEETYQDSKEKIQDL